MALDQMGNPIPDAAPSAAPAPGAPQSAVLPRPLLRPRRPRMPSPMNGMNRLPNANQLRAAEAARRESNYLNPPNPGNNWRPPQPKDNRNFVSKGLDAYKKVPVAGQIAHAVLNPITGIPMAIAANRDAIGRGIKNIGRKIYNAPGNVVRSIGNSAKKFGSGVANFGRRAIGGIANMFKWRK